MLDQLLSPLHVVRVAAEDELHPGILLFSPAKVVIGGILLYIRDLLERRFRIAVHVHRHIYRVVTDLHFLCISGISAAVGAGTAGFLALVDNAVFPFMLLEQLPS